MARKANRFNGVADMSGVESAKDISQNKRYKVGLYARISVENKGNPTNSIENQLELMRHYISEKNELSNAREYVDIGVSGTTFDRPIFKQMMEDIKSGQTNCIIVKDLSRFGRFYIETSNYIETIFPFLGVRFISVNDHFDSDARYNQNKALEVALKNLANDIYAKDVSKRVACSRNLDMKNGKFVGSNAPYGYLVNIEDPKRKYKIDEESADVVKRIFGMALGGMSFRQIAKNLEKQNLSAPGLYLRTHLLHNQDDNKVSRWYVGTISNILNNRAYIGNMIQGKRKSSQNEGKKQEKVDEEDWIVVEGAHEAIIEKEVFEQVQEVLENRVQNSKFSSERGKKIPMKKDMLADIIYCGECGRKLQFSSRLIEQSGKLKRQYYYQCRYGYDIDKSTCNVGAWLEYDLVRVVYDSLSGIIANENDKELVTNLEDLKLQKGEVYNVKIEQIEKKVKQEEYQVSKAYESYIMGEIGKDNFIKVQDISTNKTEELNKQIEQLITEKVDIEKMISKELRWWKNASKLKGRPSLNRELVEGMIKRIDVYPEKHIQITYNFNKPLRGN